MHTTNEKGSWFRVDTVAVGAPFAITGHGPVRPTDTSSTASRLADCSPWKSSWAQLSHQDIALSTMSLVQKSRYIVEHTSNVAIRGNSVVARASARD
jgi:hypothetical protein